MANSKQSIEEAAKALDLAQAELRAMYKRLGFNGSNVLDFVNKTLQELEQFKAQEQSDENVGSLVKRFGEVVAEKQKYKELYEQECTNHHYTRLSWDRTCEERDKIKAQQKPVWVKASERLPNDEYKHLVRWNTMPNGRRYVEETREFIEKHLLGLSYNLNPEWLDESGMQQPTDEEITQIAKENFPDDDWGRNVFISGFKAALNHLNK